MSVKLISAVAAVGLSAALASHAQAAIAYALTDDDSLIGFNTTTPWMSTSAVILKSPTNTAIQDLIGIDFRPSNGLLYGVGKFGAIYTINPLTGVATTTTNLTGATLNGSRFGFDFNPVTDRLTITSDSDQNLSVDVTTGAATVNGTLNLPGNPNVNGSAYTNDYTAATSTTLYAIDSVTNALYTQNPTTGALVEIGSGLGFDISGINGFDIQTVGGVNTAYAVMQQVGSGSSEFFTINLTTGLASSQGTLGGGDVFDGLAVAIGTVPEPTTLAGLAGAGVLMLRRRARQA